MKTATRERLLTVLRFVFYGALTILYFVYGVFQLLNAAFWTATVRVLGLLGLSGGPITVFLAGPQHLWLGLYWTCLSGIFLAVIIKRPARGRKLLNDLSLMRLFDMDAWSSKVEWLWSAATSSGSVQQI